TGRDALKKHLPFLKEKLSPDVVIVNGENAAAGHGITLKLAQEILGWGIDCLTTGNHAWRQRELLSTIDQEPRLLRPLNFPEGTPGKGFFLHTLQDGRTLLIVNLMTTVFMDLVLDNPFPAIDRFLESYSLGSNIDAVFIDFHGEATSEKMALAQFLDGRISALIGTHTHVPTADMQVLPCGTAFQADAGMCGDFDSVLGMSKEAAIWRFTKKTPGPRLEPTQGEATLCGSFIVTNDQTGLAESIEAVRLGGRLQPTLPTS
ncbi:MAG TPA: metallophosphoesterase, partial [Rhodospirillaceae bacterium]|nr:metallophosphoesterase [Rhodospirillaceae bacterium]